MSQPNWDQGLVRALELNLQGLKQAKPSTIPERIAMNRPTVVPGARAHLESYVENTLLQGSEVLTNTFGKPYEGSALIGHNGIPGRAVTHYDRGSLEPIITEANVVYGWEIPE